MISILQRLLEGASPAESRMTGLSNLKSRVHYLSGRSGRARYFGIIEDARGKWEMGADGLGGHTYFPERRSRDLKSTYLFELRKHGEEEGGRGGGGGGGREGREG